MVPSHHVLWWNLYYSLVHVSDTGTHLFVILQKTSELDNMQHMPVHWSLNLSCMFSQDDDDDDCCLWLFSQDKVNGLLPASVVMQLVLKARSLGLKKKASKKDWVGLEPLPLLSTVCHKIAFVFLCQTFTAFLCEILLVDCKGFTIKCAWCRWISPGD